MKKFYKQFKKLGNTRLVESDQLKCIALMCTGTFGLKFADKHNIVSFFYAMLTGEPADFDIQTSAVLGLKNCSLTDFGLWTCREFEDLPHLLLEKCFLKNQALQFNALEVNLPITMDIIIRTKIISGLESNQ